MNFAQVPSILSPAAWLDLDALDANIALVNQHTKNKKLRIASKSIRSIDVLQYIAKQSPNFVGVMSYDALESQFLIKNGFNDVLCAYPQMNPQAILACEQTVLEHQKQIHDQDNKIKMTWMVDSSEQWQLLEDIGQSLNTTLRVCIDVNLSTQFPALYFGTKRSPITSAKKLKRLLKKHRSAVNTQVVGVMGYEAQIAGLAEAAKGKEALAPIIRLLKARSKSHVAKLRQDCVKVLQATKQMVEIVNGGGSGSMQWTCSQPEITEIAVGSAYYMPGYFSDMDSMQSFTPAAGFVLPVTRKPYKNTITCQSGGFIASGAMGKDKQPVIIYPQGLEYLADEGFGEVQTPIKIKRSQPLNIGQNIWLRHAKAGELCEHFNELLVFKDGKQVDTFKTYRGQGKCFH